MTASERFLLNEEDFIVVQSIAQKFVGVLKFDPNQPRGKDGRFVDTEGVTHVGEFVELYHGTSGRRANKILKEGFKIRAVAKPTMGGDPPSSRNYIWLAKRPQSAKSYSELHLNPTVLTVRLPVGEYEKLKVRNSGPDSVWSPAAIPAKYVTKGDGMALKFVEKAENPEKPEKLPEDADRFLWTEAPAEAPKKVEYAEVLKFTRKEPLDKR